MMNSATYRLAYLGTFVVVWLLPMFWTGSTLRICSVFPLWLTSEHQISGLFLKYSKACYDFHLEWMASEGHWQEVDERMLYPYTVFADRSRFDQIISRAEGSRLKAQIQFKAVHHALQHGLELHLLPEDVKRLRIVRTEWQTGTPEMAVPTSGWRRASSLKVPESHRKVLVNYLVEGGSLKQEQISSSKHGSIPSQFPVTHVLPPKPLKPPTLQRRLVSPTVTDKEKANPEN
jgi:hypothetical protein